MAGALEINISPDFEVDEESDRSVARLKDKAKKRVGRGFKKPTSEDPDLSRREEPSVQPQKSAEGWILFVTSVHKQATEDDIYDKFAEFGAVKNIIMNSEKRTGYMNGYALVEYVNYEDASQAREDLNNAELLGQTISVDWAFITHPRKVTDWN